MEARKLLLYVLLTIPVLVLTGCNETATTEEPRAILIPSEDGSPITFAQPPNMYDGGPSPPTGQEPPGQIPLPSHTHGQSIITTAESHDGISGLIPEETEKVPLPAPQMESTVSLEEALSGSNTTGHYTELPLAASDISQLLWAAQGINEEEGNSTTPSISSTYPLVLYLIIGNVTDLKSGSYLYIPAEHELAVIKEDNLIEETGLLSDQTTKSAAYIIIAADFEGTTDGFSEDAERFCYLEAGRAAQNIYLQATALGIGTVITVNYIEEQVESATGIPAYLNIIYIMPVGGKTGL